MANEIVKKTVAASDIKSLLNGDAMKRQFALALPKICPPDRFMRVALTALNKNPKLLECKKESLLQCLMTCAELGIEPDGRRAHLIPYNSKTGMQCQMIIDYKGKIELAMRSGLVAKIHADKICENDIFEYNCGEIIRHTIDFRSDRGRAYAYYCIITNKDGTSKAEVMTLKEIQDIRKRSKAGDYGPWQTDFDEMAKKTCFHRASKWIQLSPELRRAEEVEDEDGIVAPAHIPTDASKNTVIANDISDMVETTEIQHTPPTASGLAGMAGREEDAE